MPKESLDWLLLKKAVDTREDRQVEDLRMVTFILHSRYHIPIEKAVTSAVKYYDGRDLKRWLEEQDRQYHKDILY